jgi:hypothetical protein
MNINEELKDGFNISYNFDDEIDDEYDKELERDIESNCDQFKIYVDKLEMEEKNDDELIQMEKTQIIDFKNYQLNKFKAYIISLEKEKEEEEDLIDNFRNSTNILLERIKDLEQGMYGTRPQTPNIMAQIKRNEKLGKTLNKR